MMRLFCFSIFLFFCFSHVICQDYFSTWSSVQLYHANTARDASYLSLEEKNIFLVLNLARIYPQLFNTRILQKYIGSETGGNDFLKHRKYLKSLSRELSSMSQLDPVYPSKELWEYALCHAVNSGKKGVVGHNRYECAAPLFYSECCAYGFNKAIDIVVQLLIDHNISDLGHRRIMLDSRQTSLGVSIQYHKKYIYNAVLDFSFDL